jgi:hypothetical protein
VYLVFLGFNCSLCFGFAFVVVSIFEEIKIMIADRSGLLTFLSSQELSKILKDIIMVCKWLLKLKF